MAKWKALDPPGRFLSKSGHVWFEIDDESAKKRASKSLGERSKDGSISPSRRRLASASSSGGTTSSSSGSSSGSYNSRPREFEASMPQWPELSAAQAAVMEENEEVTSDRFRLYFNSDSSKPCKTNTVSMHSLSFQDLPTNELMLASSFLGKQKIPDDVPGTVSSGDDLPTAAELASFFDAFSEQQGGQNRWLSKSSSSCSHRERMKEEDQEDQPKLRHHLSEDSIKSEGLWLMNI